MKLCKDFNKTAVYISLEHKVQGWIDSQLLPLLLSTNTDRRQMIMHYVQEITNGMSLAHWVYADASSDMETEILSFIVSELTSGGMMYLRNRVDQIVLSFDETGTNRQPKANASGQILTVKPFYASRGPVPVPQSVEAGHSTEANQSTDWLQRGIAD